VRLPDFFPAAPKAEDRKLRVSQMYAIPCMEQQAKGDFRAGIVADEVGWGKILTHI